MKKQTHRFLKIVTLTDKQEKILVETFLHLMILYLITPFRGLVYFTDGVTQKIDQTVLTIQKKSLLTTVYV